MKKAIYLLTIVILIALAASPIFGQYGARRIMRDFGSNAGRQFKNVNSSQPKTFEPQLESSASPNAAGELDAAWGSGGIAVAPLGLQEETQEIAYFLHSQPDGKVIVSGIERDANGEGAVSFIARFTANGTLDQSFGVNGKINGSNNEFYYATALQPDGKIVAAGYKRLPNSSVIVSALARHNPDGTLDQTFGGGGKVFSPVGEQPVIAGDLLLQPDGKIVAVGYVISGDHCDFAVARYNSNGSLDAAFGNGGKVVVDIPSGSFVVYLTTKVSAALQPDGKVVIGGTGGVADYNFILTRLLSNGALDSTFGTNGQVVTALSSNDDDLYDIALQPDGKIIAAGNANQIYNGGYDTALVRYHSNGAIDTSFAQNGILEVKWNNRYYVGNAVAVQPNGKILGFGFGFVGATNALGFATARYNPDGTPDPSFGINGRVVTKINDNNFSFAFEGIVQPDGKILVCGGTEDSTAIVRYLNDSVRRTRTQFDFDGDGRADISVFRRGSWYISNSSNNSFRAEQFGLSADKIVPADYDGDGRTDLAVFRDGIWYVQRSRLGFAAIPFGQTGDVPVPGDYDGDGLADVAVFRAGTWYILNSSNNSFRAEQFGLATDKPIIGDFDNDGRQDLAVFRDGMWFVQRSREGFFAAQFGLTSDKIIPADYDGDGRTDLAVFRAGVWYLWLSGIGVVVTIQFGLSGDIPFAGDFDGDSQADIAVYRNGTWYLGQSAIGFAIVHFGLADDKPVPAAFLP